MALFRCAACGSPNVVTDQEDNGIQFDYVKGGQLAPLCLAPAVLLQVFPISLDLFSNAVIVVSPSAIH